MSNNSQLKLLFVLDLVFILPTCHLPIFSSAPASRRLTEHKKDASPLDAARHTRAPRDVRRIPLLRARVVGATADEYAPCVAVGVGTPKTACRPTAGTIDRNTSRSRSFLG